MRIVQGDLLKLALDGEFDVIVHGCNCQCAMGKGIALAIKQQFPEAYAADCATEKGSRAKLGSFSSATVERHGRSFMVVNAYTQFDWRGSGVKVDYDAIRTVMRSIAASFADCRIGYPKIGAGLAGGDWAIGRLGDWAIGRLGDWAIGRLGDWAIISAAIDEELQGLDHTLVEYSN